MRYYDGQYDDSGMRTLFGWSKLVRTRKPHPCDTCPSFIMPAGTKAEAFCYKTTETPFGQVEYGWRCPTSYWHDTCMKQAQQAKERYDREHS